ncbi:hypothetical protein GCM10007385_35020 [Tateyamaria omphalii]|nr:hypothetical protein GCM10007385_35020 [Tateyamaria omphalii]
MALGLLSKQLRARAVLFVRALCGVPISSAALAWGVGRLKLWHCEAGDNSLAVNVQFLPRCSSRPRCARENVCTQRYRSERVLGNLV